MQGRTLCFPKFTPPIPVFEDYRQKVARFDPVLPNGKVAQVIGLVIEFIGPNAMLGEICDIYYDRATHFDPGKPPIKAEASAFGTTGCCSCRSA